MFSRIVMAAVVVVLMVHPIGAVLALPCHRMLVQKSDNKLFIMVDIINIVTWF